MEYRGLAGFDLISMRDAVTGSATNREPSRGDHLIKVNGRQVTGYSEKSA